MRCPNPQRGEHRIPLARQTWLARKKNHYIALKPITDNDPLVVDWSVVKADDKDDLGFDPARSSSRGRATCLICGTSVDTNYIKEEGMAGRLEAAPLAAVLLHSSGRGREYVAAGGYPEPAEEDCLAVIEDLDIEPPNEPVCTYMDAGFRVAPYGLRDFRDLFTPRQLATLCSLSQGVHEIHSAMVANGVDQQVSQAVCSYLGLVVTRTADHLSTLCRWHTRNESVLNTYARQALPMVWDYCEVNPFGGAGGDVLTYVNTAAEIIEGLAAIDSEPSVVQRGSADALPYPDATYDAVITDPPYYDNIWYADLSDFFYVWLKRAIGFLLPGASRG